MKNMIIEHPEWQRPKQKYFMGTITVIFWMGWFYLWLPLLSVLAWLFQINTFEYQMIELGGYQGAIDLMASYTLVICILGGSLIGWAAYNIHRFGNKGRRQARPVVTVAMQARHFRVDENALAGWQKSQLIIIEHGHIHALSEAR